MKIFGIFYIENGVIYPVGSNGNGYWLGGSKVWPLIFPTRKEAEALIPTVRGSKDFWLKGKLKVCRVEIRAII